MKKIIVTILIGILLLSCQTSVLKSEPSDDGKVLVLGRLTMEAYNYETYKSSTVNGIHNKKIEMKFKKTNSEEIIKVYTINDLGIFYFKATPETDYELIDLYYHVSNIDDHSWASLRKKYTDKKFTTSADGVTSLGAITWYSDPKENIFELRVNENYDDFYNLFTKTYKKSEWIDKNWYPKELNPE
ncbi:MAG: hypothetical protein JXR64_05235 [Spirochaetales bacterium]|nr:hypothetical protein [Spirochaetales bacterium]